MCQIKECLMPPNLLVIAVVAAMASGWVRKLMTGKGLLLAQPAPTSRPFHLYFHLLFDLFID